MIQFVGNNSTLATCVQRFVKQSGIWIIAFENEIVLVIFSQDQMFGRLVSGKAEQIPDRIAVNSGGQAVKNKIERMIGIRQQVERIFQFNKLILVIQANNSHYNQRTHEAEE